MADSPTNRWRALAGRVSELRQRFGTWLNVVAAAVTLLAILWLLAPGLSGVRPGDTATALWVAAAAAALALLSAANQAVRGVGKPAGGAVAPGLADPLTGLPNRVLLAERLQRQVVESGRDGRRFALLLIDLDRFRTVNELFGREVGDRILKRVAERIRAPLRDVDTVARVDGDEFALVVRVDNREQAQVVAAKVLARLDEPCEVVGARLPLSASIGVALFPDHGRQAADLMQHAEAAREAASRSPDHCAVYDPGESTARPDRLMLLAGLRDGLRAGQLYLVLQPQLDLARPAAAKFEALVRWRHPAQGDLAPDEFLPFVEQTSAITDLTQWVVDEVLRLLADRRAAQVSEVAVNLSVRVLADASFGAWVAQRLQTAGVAPGRLRFEVTETAIMNDSARALGVLQELAALGLGLSLDDFGVGYSSLAYLARLPLDEIKIDRGFVAMLVEAPGSRSIVRATIDLGHDLGMRVVAEGVETRAQADLLAELGCDVLQGHLLGPVRTPRELLEAEPEREAL